LIHHAANREHTYPAGSLSALKDCLLAGARAVEIDITPLADGAFALLHDSDLAVATDGTGTSFTSTAEQIRQYHYKHQGQPTIEPVGLLSQAVALVQENPDLQELQLDLKPHAYLGERPLQALLEQIAPAKRIVRVSSAADWALRGLHLLDPALALGFDPLLYLDVETGQERPQAAPPLRIGSYGYWDDHPLAVRQWGSSAEYLKARAEALLAQAPPGGVWYIRALLLARALEDGFDWTGYLQARGVQVAAWTLDIGKPGHLALSHRLIEAGVDRITTNNPPALAAALGHTVLY
jgi:glycerophosphoryl diester phosphodiesterase